MRKRSLQTSTNMVVAFLIIFGLEIYSFFIAFLNSTSLPFQNEKLQVGIKRPAKVWGHLGSTTPPLSCLILWVVGSFFSSSFSSLHLVFGSSRRRSHSLVGHRELWSLVGHWGHSVYLTEIGQLLTRGTKQGHSQARIRGRKTAKTARRKFTRCSFLGEKLSMVSVFSGNSLSFGRRNKFVIFLSTFSFLPPRHKTHDGSNGGAADAVVSSSSLRSYIYILDISVYISFQRWLHIKCL
jgi:hypothetical protein